MGGSLLESVGVIGISISGMAYSSYAADLQLTEIRVIYLDKVTDPDRLRRREL